MRQVKHGVPQGSVIGPLMYTVYINKLPAILQDKENCEDNIHQTPQLALFPPNCQNFGLIPSFADDATIVTNSNSRDLNQIKLIESMKTVKNFLTTNQLTMNDNYGSHDPTEEK